MVFSSVFFIFAFLPSVLIVYYLINPRYRNVFLLISSLLYYAWGEPKFVLVMIASIIINYSCGLLVDVMNAKLGIRRLILFLAVMLNLGLLFYYKYFMFFITMTNRVFQTHFSVPAIVLPIGISFFTFQGMSYVIDVYKRTVSAQRNPIHVGTYIALFPQLIAGPIVRYVDICEQLENRSINVCLFNSGIRRFIIGLSKKVLIANVLAEVADSIFGMGISGITTPIAWTGAVCYTMQIFFDFSGYSDMAIGLGRMFGFEFMENFNLPYISKSVTEFWRRWHISLSTWFRDYLYIPMGGNRKGNVYLHLFIVFLCTGIWHGAALTFIVWGIWHGMFLLVERIFRIKHGTLRIPNMIKWFYTMMVVMLGWVLFRAEYIRYAIRYILAMFGMAEKGFKPYTVFYYLDMQVVITLIFAVLLSSSLPSMLKSKLVSLNGMKVLHYTEHVLLLLFFALSIIIIVNGGYNPFIYFRF